MPSPAVSSSKATSNFGVQRRFNGSYSSGSSSGLRRKTVGPSILNETFEEEPSGTKRQIVSRNSSSGKSEEHLSIAPSLQPNLLQPRANDLK